MKDIRGIYKPEAKQTRPTAEGWIIVSNTEAVFNGKSAFDDQNTCEGWSYEVTVTVIDGNLNVEVDDWCDCRGQAHGGSSIDITIPMAVLTALLKGG